MNFTSALKHRLVVFVAICITACGYGGRTINWKQEVKLGDGRVILLERESKQGPHDPLLNIRMELSQRVAFAHPDSGERIQWEIPNGLLPIMLDVEAGVPYFVLRAYTVTDYNTWDCPNPPWLVYRYEQKDWSRTSMEQLPARINEQNLLSSAEGKKFDKGATDIVVSVREVAQYLKERNVVPNATRIGREKVNPIGHGCHESVLIRLGRQSEIDTRR